MRIPSFYVTAENQSTIRPPYLDPNEKFYTAEWWVAWTVCPITGKTIHRHAERSDLAIDALTLEMIDHYRQLGAIDNEKYDLVDVPDRYLLLRST